MDPLGNNLTWIAAATVAAGAGNGTDGANATDPLASDINSFYFYETEQFTFLSILFALIVVGNSAVLVALLLSKRRKSRMNFFIMQLALADLSVGLISVMTDIIWRYTVTWNAGNAACKLIRFLQVVVTYSSTYVLVALSIDRYDAITHPMNFSGSWRRARLLVSVAWIISILFSLPMVILYNEKPIEGREQCWIEFKEPWQWQLYVTLVAVTVFIVPALIISACYTVIVSTIWTKSKQLTTSASTAIAAVGLHGSGLDQRRRISTRSVYLHGSKHRMLRHQQLQQEEHDCRRASSRGIIPKAKVKTVKMTFVIVFVFVVCWSPYIVFDLLQVYGYVPRTQNNIAIASFIQSLAPLNSAANPLIYCLFSTQIGRTLRNTPPFSWVTAALNRCCPKGGNNNGNVGTGGAGGGVVAARDSIMDNSQAGSPAGAGRWSSRRRKTHRLHQQLYKHDGERARRTQMDVATAAAVVTVV